MLTAIITTARENLAKLAEVRRDLSVCRQMHAGMKGTARALNAGRIKRLELAERLALAAVTSSEADLSAL